MKLDPYLNTYTKINWKWIKGLTVVAKTIKPLEENTGKFQDTGFDNDFLDMTAKAQERRNR